MGRTFKHNKSTKKMGKRLDTHRDLPDIDPDEEYPYDEQDMEEYYARRMDDQKPPNKPEKG